MLLPLLTACLAFAATPDDARAAFDGWVAKGAAFDATVADYYTDDARITLLRDGKPLKTLPGSHMKALMRKGMSTAKKAEDHSTFDQITVQAEGDGFRVRAHRTSARKCYTDPDFHQLWKEVDGQLRIVEEQLGSVALSRCPPSEALAAAMATVVKGITPHLPLALDEETTLDAVAAEGRVLRYSMKLVKMASTEVDPGTLYAEVSRGAMRGGCSDATLRSLMEQGATVLYAYRFSDDKPLGELPLTAATCAMLK